MPSFTSLTISGYRDEPIPNTFIRQDNTTPHLAILFPGYGYRVTMPLLYYPQRLLVGRGADVLCVEYAYDRHPGFRNLTEAEWDRWFSADIEAACDAGLAQRPYQRLTLVGKSLGTLATAHLLTTDTRLERADCVWLTPLLHNERQRAQIVKAKPRSLFVVGTADTHYDRAVLRELEQATGGQSVVIEGADHSLEIEGSVPRSLDALRQVLDALAGFLGGEAL
jgi:hypothetical protein